MERGASLDRITLALAKLKTELMDMRSQDVKLMKQLISINLTIGSMTKGQQASRCPVLRSASVGSLKRQSMVRLPTRGAVTAAPCLRHPLVRHRSAPTMVGGVREDGNSDIDDGGASSPTDSENDITFLCNSASSIISSNQLSPPTYLRPLPEEEDTDEKMYYGILMKNIKLWKYSQESINSSESDSSIDG
ncbi:uncharacterized protein LOC111104032 [Crassostrea virginica]